MAKQKKIWMSTTPKHKKPSIPASLKQELGTKVEDVLENIFRPKYIKPPPTDHDFNYLADLYLKWYRSYLYICGTYNCPSPRAISPSFEAKFTRIEYAGGEKFNLAYMRHTGQWWEVYPHLSMDECLKSIVEEVLFHPH